MKNNLYILAIALMAVLTWNASALAQKSNDSFDPSEDFRKSYPTELKKKDTWQTRKSRWGENQPDKQEETSNESYTPPPSAPQPPASQAQTTEPTTARRPPKVIPLDQLPSSMPAPRDSGSEPTQVYQEPVYTPPPAYTPPPPAAQPNQTPAYQEPEGYMPPAGYYDQGGTAPAPTGQQPSRPVSGEVDNSAFEDYRQPASTESPGQPAAAQDDKFWVAPETQPAAPTAQPTAEEGQPSALPGSSTVQAPQASRPFSSVEATDYASADSWMYRTESPDKSVDVFFLYTGSCDRPGICSISDQSMRQKALEKTMKQAGAFEPIGNLFVPYYRQLNSGIFLGLKPADRSARLAASSADAYAAFDYYLNHYNGGRPFILAAHGQGSAALLEGVLSHYLEQHPAARQQMVAAYAIGYSVTVDYLTRNSHLRIAERRNDVGVVISYSTEAPGVKATNPAVLPGAVAINPVNWTRSERKALQQNSRGANLSVFGEEEYKEAFADARINMARGVVECSTADLDKYADPDYPHGAFPGGDYAFYFYDLRANAQERVDAYQQSRP